MRYFQQLAAGIDVAPLLLAIKRQEHLFQAQTLRQDAPGSMHADTDAILLRWQQQGDPLLDCRFTDAWTRLPQARDLVLGILRRVEGIRLGRVMVARLKAHGRILPHRDTDQDTAGYVKTFSRFHLPLQTSPGCVFTCQDEALSMDAGSLYWFANWERHEVQNASDVARLHLIVDCEVAP
jgi:hypothetical protein